MKGLSHTRLSKMGVDYDRRYRMKSHGNEASTVLHKRIHLGNQMCGSGNVLQMYTISIRYQIYRVRLHVT